MILSLDTETTGVDFKHGSKPFLVTICNAIGINTWWEWDVDPLTRQPVISAADLAEIQTEINKAKLLILQNPKFDFCALQTIFSGFLKWDWKKVRDTLIAGHLLASNHPHDLATMAIEYVSVDIQKHEDQLKKIVNEARGVARREFPYWKIAKEGMPELPSAKGKVWKNDLWLPRAIAKEKNYSSDHKWWSVCSTYANIDSAITLTLYRYQKKILEQRGLWRIYRKRLKILPIISAIEDCGITINRKRLEELIEEYNDESNRASNICANIASDLGVDLQLPKSGNNKSLLDFVFNDLKLPVVKSSKKTGKPSLDKLTLEQYEATLPKRSKKLLFIRSLKGKRKRDTAINYLKGYKKFWLPLKTKENNPDWFVLSPSVNATGTDTLRWSYSNPNGQNISKQEGFNLRHCFGPAPGREWWSLDVENIELRIPAYEANETEMINLFDRPNDPPYYGSYHLLIFDTLHPKEFSKYGIDCKNIYKSTLYQWTKNGNFAVQYGAVEESGTADRAYHVAGAQRRIQNRFSRIAALNQKMISLAKQQGYVETIPDKTVDPDHGYPLICTRSQYGEIKPTVPLNYHVQGTAMQWMTKAMIRCFDYLQNFPKHNMIIQVHDEIVFDFQITHNNKTIVLQLKKLMEQGGDDIGLPTPVGIEYHSKTWAISEPVKF